MTYQPGPPVPRPELMVEWRSNRGGYFEDMTIAAAWGADQELKACEEFILSEVRSRDGAQGLVRKLYATRRPDGHISKREAANALSRIMSDMKGTFDGKPFFILRDFLDSLPD